MSLKKKYWDTAYKLRRLIKDDLSPMLLERLIDLLELENEEEFVEFFVESSLTGIDIDWSNKTVVFIESIIEELDDLIGDYELKGLFD
ncbi:MAG: hypothetical protein ACW967_03100 [Candidatus Hodarchaeales archaeon]|jgi:hypothetical protein